MTTVLLLFPQFLCPPAEQHLAKCSVELASLLGMALFCHLTLFCQSPQISGLGTSKIRTYLLPSLLPGSGQVTLPPHLKAWLSSPHSCRPNSCPRAPGTAPTGERAGPKSPAPAAFLVEG